MTAIVGRILTMMVNKANVLTSVQHEKSSVLTITRTFVTGAGMKSTDNKSYNGKRSWMISSELLMNVSEFEYLFGLVSNGTTVSVSFGSSDSIRFDGNAFITSLRVQGNNGELVKVSVTWQGTGKLTRYVKQVSAE